MTIFESRSSRLASAVGLMLLLAMAVSLVMIVPAEAKRRDSIPPTFAGLKSAITLYPGADRWRANHELQPQLGLGY